MKRDCQKTRDHISDLISGTLPEADEHALREHLIICADCRKCAQALEQEDALLIDHFAQIDADMAARQARVLPALEYQHAKPTGDIVPIWRGMMKRRISRLAVAAAVVFATILGIHHFARSFHATNTVTAPVVPRHGRSEPGRTNAGHQIVSPLELATAISLEKAFRQGGIEAVEDQYRRAYGTPQRDAETPSIEELLTDLETELNHLGSKNI